MRSYAGKYSVTRRTSCLSGSAEHAGNPGNGQPPLLAGRAVARAPRVSAVAFATRCAGASQNEKTNNIRLVNDIQVGRRPRDMHFNADHTKLYVACGR